MISRFFTTEFTVARQGWKVDEDGNQYSTAEAENSFLGHLQQARKPEIAESLQLAFTKTCIAWCPLGTNVSVGDELTAEGVKYAVRAKTEHRLGRNAHLELILERHG